MPEIGRVSGATIKIYVNDHAPPHVHVHHQGDEVRLRIADAAPLDPIRGFHAGVLTAVRKWLLENRDTVANEWAKYHDMPEYRDR